MPKAKVIEINLGKETSFEAIKRLLDSRLIACRFSGMKAYVAARGVNVEALIKAELGVKKRGKARS